MQPTDPNASLGPASRRPGWTYLLLSVGAGLTLLIFSPQLLVAFGLMNESRLQAMATLAGILLGIPTFLLLIVALGFSIAGLIRGPARLRLHVEAWWVLAVGSFAASLATAKRPAYNPYLGTPHPGLGLSDVILAVGLLLCVALPLLWRRSRNP